MRALSIRLSDELFDRLNELASATGRTKTYYVTEAVNQHLEDLEDLYIAERRWRDVQEGRSRMIPLEEVINQLDD